MEKDKGKRKMEKDDGGFQKLPRLGTEQETPAREVEEAAPPVEQWWNTETYAPDFAAYFSFIRSKTVTYAPEVTYAPTSACSSPLSLKPEPEAAVPPPARQADLHEHYEYKQETLAPVVDPPPPVEQPDLLKYEVGETITSRYEVVSKIGEGTYGLVLECLDRKEWEYVAIKIPKSEGGHSEKYEVKLLQRCAKSEARSRIVQFREAFVLKNRYFIVSEMLGPSLHEFLTLNNRLAVPIGLIRILGRQLLEAIACLRDTKIIHTDLKPDNILFVSQLKAHKSSSNEVQLKYLPRSNAIKVIDFGLAVSNKRRKKLKDRGHLPIVGARLYRAPEVILGLDWSYPVDVWSVGCILAEMCTGMELFSMESDNDDEHLAIMKMVLGEFPEEMVRMISLVTGKEWASNWQNYSKFGYHTLQDSVSDHAQGSDPTQLIDLLFGLLRYDQSKRLTASQALEHQFFKNPL